MKKTDEETSVILIRALYRLALAGIDVNARDALGETALIKAASTLDQNLMAHIIRIGVTAWVCSILKLILKQIAVFRLLCRFVG